AGRRRCAWAWLRLVGFRGAADAGVRLVHADRQPRAQRAPGPPVPRCGRAALRGAVSDGRAPGRVALGPLGRRHALVARAAARVARSSRDALGRPRALGRGHPRADRTLAVPAAALRASRLLRGRPPRRALLPSVAAALSLVSAHRAVQGIGLELARRVRPDDLLVHEGPLENSGALEWYTGHRPVIVDGRQSVLAFGALRPEARDVFWDAARLERAWGGGSRVWVVSLRAPGASVVTRLPGARLVAASGGRWLWVNSVGG